MTKKLELNDSKNNSQANEEELDITHIYTKLSEAKEEVWRRWNDKELRKKVEEFLGGDVPGVFRDGPRSVFARHIITPNMEFKNFCEISDFLDLKKVGWEFLDDKFYTVNPEKLHLCKLLILDEQKNQYKAKKIVDFKSNLEGKMLSEIKTLSGKRIVDFHHDLSRKMDSVEIERYDASSWYNSYQNIRDCYEKYLSFFVAYGVLFENFLNGNSSESKFTKNVVLPAFNEVQSFFGVKPIIIPPIFRKCEEELGWLCYDKDVEKYID